MKVRCSNRECRRIISVGQKNPALGSGVESWLIDVFRQNARPWASVKMQGIRSEDGIDRIEFKCHPRCGRSWVATVPAVEAAYARAVALGCSELVLGVDVG